MANGQTRRVVLAVFMAMLCLMAGCSNGGGGSTTAAKSKQALGSVAKPKKVAVDKRPALTAGPAYVHDRGKSKVKPGPQIQAKKDSNASATTWGSGFVHDRGSTLVKQAGEQKSPNVSTAGETQVPAKTSLWDKLGKTVGLNK